MTSKRHQRRKSCEGKRRYATSQDANDQIQHMKRTHALRGLVVSYHCKFCAQYHIGHVSKPIRRPRQA